MTIELESMAVKMPEVKEHPNRAAFRGILTVVDVPSDRAPSGSKGKRVLLTKRAAEAAIPSLIGMAVDYAPSFDRHDVKRKVGVITRAEVVGRNLEVGGYLYAKDFPEIVREIARVGRRPEPGVGYQASGVRTADPVSAADSQLSASGGDNSINEGIRLRTSLTAAVQEIRRLVRSGCRERGNDGRGVSLRAETPLALMDRGCDAGGAALGMSFEVTKVNVLNRNARVWRLIGVTFTGAAILRKDKAAFQDTWIELE